MPISRQYLQLFVPLRFVKNYLRIRRRKRFIVCPMNKQNRRMRSQTYPLRQRQNFERQE